MTSPPPPSYTDDDEQLARLLAGLDLTSSAPATPPRPSPALYAYRTPVSAGTTSSWAEAAAETQGVSGASPRRLSPKKAKRRKPSGGYAVFCGRRVGSFKDWIHDVVELVIRVPNSLFQGYPTLAQAELAFLYAQDRGWTRVIDVNGSFAPTTIARPPLPVASNHSPNPLHAGSSTEGAWYVVYAGITPGVYASSLECSLNTLGMSGAAFESCSTHDETLSLFRSRLKQLPPSEQEAFKARARVASARYRATLRQRQQDCANGNKLSQLNEWSLFNTPTCS
ncbi:hypothetical protein C8R46DRAFT_1233198 [Mycena filopes]|nr:hypothetical protein C8R46DRAFT_1233198 [Mycena filopes]